VAAVRTAKLMGQMPGFKVDVGRSAVVVETCIDGSSKLIAGGVRRIPGLPYRYETLKEHQIHY
jgi:hypothetical protein